MSKKFEEFGKEFSAITAKHEEAIKRLKDGRDKTDEKLTKAVADRAAVMDELDLDKARELKREIVDLQSDIETYDARIKKAEETRKEELAAFVKRVEADTWAYSKNVNPKKFGSMKEAMDAAKRIRDEKLVVMTQGFSVCNFRTIQEIYQKSYELMPVRMKTRERHDHFFKYAMADYGSMTIDKIKTADIQKSINDYAKDHTHIQTEHLLAVWRRLYRTAAMMDLNIPDRTYGVRIPECKQDQPRKKEVSATDLEKFIDALLTYNSGSEVGNYQSTGLYSAIRIMQYCGLRPAETFALTREDIHLRPGSGSYISINKASHSTTTNILEVGKTKTQRSIRNVPVPEPLKQILIDCLNWSKYDLLFADYYGNLRDIDETSNYVMRVSKKAGVSFHMYALRHQLSTDLFSAGVAPNVVRDLLGHESASMSLDYAVSNEKDRTAAMENRLIN